MLDAIFAILFHTIPAIMYSNFENWKYLNLCQFIAGNIQVCVKETHRSDFQFNLTMTGAVSYSWLTFSTMMDLSHVGRSYQCLSSGVNSLNRLYTIETKVLSLRSAVLAIVSTVSRGNLLSRKDPSSDHVVMSFPGFVAVFIHLNKMNFLLK